MEFGQHNYGSHVSESQYLLKQDFVKEWHQVNVCEEFVGFCFVPI